ncbi:MAG: tetratricopeptide repeat protein [Verrucomicrobiota bacterium]
MPPDLHVIRLWCFRLLALLGIPLLLFAGLEGGLRLIRFGHPTAFFALWPASLTNLCVDNPRFGWRFFPSSLAPEPRTFAFPESKRAGTLRIFVLGESAALGDPDPKFGFPPMLKALLRERFPRRHFEVVNLSMVAINSHVIRLIAQECAGKQGDVWVIYMGNNEVIGPFGSGTIFGSQAPPLALVRAHLAVKATRVGQLLDTAVQRAQGEKQARPEWRGMEMFLEQRVRRDDPRTARVYDHFQHNLADILEAGRRAGVRILLCTVGTNLKDCQPFASLHRPDLTGAPLAEWEAAYQGGAREEAQGRFAEALAAYQQAAGIDAHYAELQFRMGRCHLALGQQTEARPFFQQARDDDALQFRTGTRLNEIIRQSAAAHSGSGARLVDVEELMARRSPQGVPGGEFFYEHVHLTPEGNYLIAQALAEEIAAAFTLDRADGGLGTAAPPETPKAETGSIPAGRKETGGGWLTQAECLQQLGFNESSRYDCLSTVLDRIKRPPFSGQSNHAAQVQNIETELRRLRPAIKPAQLKRAIPHLREIVSRHPEDPDLRKNLAGLLELVSDFAGAEAEWRAIIQVLPHAAPAYFNLAGMLEHQQRPEEALGCLAECLQRNPEFPPAHERLGLLLAERDRFAEAIPHLKATLRLKPNAIDVRLSLAQILVRQGQRSQAAKQFQEVLRLDPSNAEAKRLLDATLSR